MKIPNDGGPIRKGSCPKCRSTEVVPIIYGLPSPELVEEAHTGGIVLGGCVVRDERWCCKRCGNRWGRRGSGQLHWVQQSLFSLLVGEGRGGDGES